jgi:DNA-binding transcriptional MerR regulator
VKISELAATSGVTVPTIKYYLREGLLTAGERSSANQASYGDGHLQRLRLIRALLDTGGLPVATAREVLAAIDDPDLPLTWIFGIAQHAISDSGLYAPITDSSPGLEKVDAFLKSSGWHVSPENPGRFGAARVLDSYESAGHPELAEIWDGYAAGSELIAQVDLATVGRKTDVEAMSETVVVGTVLGDAMLSSLRRMAQEHVSSQLFPGRPEERSKS